MFESGVQRIRNVNILFLPEFKAEVVLTFDILRMLCTHLFFGQILLVVKLALIYIAGVVYLSEGPFANVCQKPFR